MAKGVDANSDLTNHAKCLFDHGYRFAGRYIKRTPSALTHSEAVALTQAGLWIVSIVEIGFPTTPEHFTRQQGLADGHYAYTYARDHLNQPPGSCLYHTVDFDPSPDEVHGPITNYFEAVNEAFHAASAGQPRYALGVYGSGLVCSTLAQSTAVTYTWLAMSRGWRGSKSYAGWSIQQTVGLSVCGVSVDEDVSTGHSGGWQET